MSLVKAELHSEDGPQYSFEFMYNPTEISISRRAEIAENNGARSEKEGIPKVSFAHPNAASISIKNIIFDAYERSDRREIGADIQKLTQSVKFVQGEKRPPIYIFRWGKINYLRCYVESLDYQLTLFLADGTPVRAKASINLKEIDPDFKPKNPAPASNRRTIDSRW